MSVSKVVFGDSTLIDLTADTITAKSLREGYTAHKADGELITGTLNTAAVEPYVEEFRKGWVGSGVWSYQNPTDTLVDIYWLIAGHEYWLTLGANVGTRFRAMFTTVDVTTITSGKVTGTNVKNTDNPAPYANFWYTPSSDGYLVIGKDNVGVTGIKTYLYDKTASWL